MRREVARVAGRGELGVDAVDVAPRGHFELKRVRAATARLAERGS